MKIKGSGVEVCPKVTSKNIVELQRVAEAAERREIMTQPKKVPLPPPSSAFTGISF